jgi:transcription antitermination factor NusG
MTNWYCLYTKAKQEEVVTFKLLKHADIQVFNPKLKMKKFVRGSLKEVIEELFPCYIFSRFDPYQYYHMIKYTRGVKRIVGNNEGYPFIIDPGLVEGLQQRMRDGYVLLESPDLLPGEPVLIREGPFKGLEGILVKEMKASDRVLVLLNTIHYNAKVQVDKAFLSKP